MRLSEIAKLIDGELLGSGDTDIAGVRKIEEAGQGDVSFIANPKYIKFEQTTGATALIVDQDFQPARTDISYIRTQDPYMGFLRVLRLFAPPIGEQRPGVHPTAVIGSDVTIGSDVAIGPYVVVGDGSVLGDRCSIFANTVIGANVHVGSDSAIHANVSIYHGTRIGNRVTVHSGTVLGADGFGFAPGEGGAWEKIPQIGIVVIEDEVEIGANVTIDRATLGETRICRGVKLDNLIHVAHNVVIGQNTVIAAQTGISGSTKIGARNMIAGQVGIVGHIETAEHVIVEPQSGVSKSIRKPGRYFGHPAKEHLQALRQEGALRQLPDVLQEIRELRARIKGLEAALGYAEQNPIE